MQAQAVAVVDVHTRCQRLAQIAHLRVVMVGGIDGTMDVADIGVVAEVLRGRVPGTVLPELALVGGALGVLNEAEHLSMLWEVLVVALN